MGQLHPKAGRVWFNLELARKQVACLEYVMVHGLAHLRERSHTERFTALLDGFLPNWRGLPGAAQRRAAALGLTTSLKPWMTPVLRQRLLGQNRKVKQKERLAPTCRSGRVKLG